MRLVVHHVRSEFPRLTIVARARADVDREALANEGVSEIVLPETEAALEMARFTLTRLGVSAAETQAIVVVCAAGQAPAEARSAATAAGRLRAALVGGGRNGAFQAGHVSLEDHAARLERAEIDWLSCGLGVGRPSR